MAQMAQNGPNGPKWSNLAPIGVKTTKERSFFTLFLIDPKIEVWFLSTRRETPPPGLVKDHTFYGVFSATFPNIELEIFHCVPIDKKGNCWKSSDIKFLT